MATARQQDKVEKVMHEHKKGKPQAGGRHRDVGSGPVKAGEGELAVEPKMAASLGSGFGPLTARSVHLCIMQLVFAAPAVTADQCSTLAKREAKRGE